MKDKIEVLSSEESREYKENIFESIEFIKSKSTNDMNGTVNDIMSILAINKNNIESIESQNFIKRSWKTITGSNKKLKEINGDNLLTVQKLSLTIISELEKKNMLTREMQVNIYEKLNEVKESQVKFKIFINNILNNIADRLEKVESDTSFNMLLHEIAYGMYDNESKVEALLIIMTKVSKVDIIDERKINLLQRALINKSLISDEEIRLKDILEEIGALESENAKLCLDDLSMYVDNIVISTIVKSLEYASLDKKKKKFLKFTPILNKIGAEIELEAELSLVEIFEFIVEDKSQLSNNTDLFGARDKEEQLLQEGNKEKYEGRDIVSNVSSEDSIAENLTIDTSENLEKDEVEYIKTSINIMGDDEYILENKRVIIEKPIYNKGIVKFINCDIEIRNNIEVEGTLLFEKCNINFNNKELKWYIYAKGAELTFNKCFMKADSFHNYGEIIFSVKSRVVIEKCNIQQIGNFIKYDSENRGGGGFGLASRRFISLEEKFDKINNNDQYGDFFTKFNTLYGCDKNWNHYIKIIDCKFENTFGNIIYYNYADDAKVEIVNCDIHTHTPLDLEYDNSNLSYGRAIFTIECESILFENVNISNSNAPVIYSSNKELRIKRCKFTDINIGKYIMVLSNSLLECEETEFFNCNSIYYSPGCGEIENFKGIFRKCKFKVCKAADGNIVESCSSDRRGGALEFSCASVLIDECEFEECNARIGGAIYLRTFTKFEINACKFKECKAEKPGGAIRIYTENKDARASIENCIFENCKIDNNKVDSEIDVDNSYETGIFKKSYIQFNAAYIRNNYFK